jgi:hypothetical protein
MVPYTFRIRFMPFSDLASLVLSKTNDLNPLQGLYFFLLNGSGGLTCYNKITSSRCRRLLFQNIARIGVDNRSNKSRVRTGTSCFVIFLQRGSETHHQY